MKKRYFVIAAVAFFTLINTSSSIVNLILYSLAIIPLAVILGELTSELSDYIGDKKGGLLAATMGNVPELMMGIWAIKYGMVPMVKAALIGSIINNMLLVLGISIFCSGIKYKEQNFKKMVARTNFNMLILAMFSMVVIATLNTYSKLSSSTLISISVKVALVLMFIYILGLVFSLYTHSNLFIISEREEQCDSSKLGNYGAIAVSILITSVLIYIISEKLISNINNVVEYYRVSQEFLGIILIPVLGNIGENISAIMFAMKNKINLSLETAIGSSIQIALFVTPILIIFSHSLSVPMTFLFSNFEIIMSAIAIGMSYLVFQDGKTYWLEGAILMAIYIMITLAFYYVA